MSVSSTAFAVETETIPVPLGSTTVPYNYTVTWTNLGPLTTTFTPPAECNPPEPVVQLISPSAGQNFLVAGACYQAASTVPVSRFSCQPSAPAISSLVANNYSTYVAWQTYFSPGISCPSGYSTAHNFTLGPSDISVTPTSAYTFATAGTHAWCCPSSYTYDQSAYGCVTDIKTAFTADQCDPLCAYSCATPDYITTSLTSSTTCTPKCTASPYSWNPGNASVTPLAYFEPVYLIYQESDLPKGGLSLGAKIAIGVVVPVVVLIALVAGALVLMNKKKNKRQASAGQAPWLGAPLWEVQQIH